MTLAKTQPMIPEFVLDQAFYWSVKLNSGLAKDYDRELFEQWLTESKTHQEAWSKVQLVEEEFMPLRECGDTNRQVLSSASQRSPFKRAGLATCIVFCFLAWLWGYQGTGQVWFPDYHTQTGEQHQLALSDGSQLWLSSNTKLDIEQHRQRLAIHLYQGEILVDSSQVSPAHKPVVKTRFGQFMPIGTRFVVSESADQSRLAVIKGQVQLQAVHQALTTDVVAGEQWQVNAENARLIASNGLQPGAWVDGIIQANDASLATVLELIDQYHPGWLRYSEQAGQLRVTGVFRLDDTESALAALQQTLPIEIKKTTPFWLTVEAR